MERTIIIAEAGVNHNGDLNNAFKLVDVAVDAGVDYVKFQTFKTENLVSKSAKKANYQIQNSDKTEESQFEMLKKLELSEGDHQEIIEYCKIKNIKFFSTAFDLDSLQYLSDIGLEIVKIPSGEITNLPYLRKAATLFNKVILSTGMSTLDEIKDALDVFLIAGINKSDVTILHCNTEYPTPMNDVNLKAMQNIGETFNTKIGYSDHTLGIEIPIAAVALGASVIEKHYTLDKNMDGPDHKASLEPRELKSMVTAIRNIEKAMSGSGLKQPSTSELKNIAIARKSIVAKKDIKSGELLTEDNLTIKRPGDGISPMLWDKVLGNTAIKDFREDELIVIG
jgi:N,N'-diacetyllegionaminate synthase